MLDTFGVHMSHPVMEDLNLDLIDRPWLADDLTLLDASRGEPVLGWDEDEEEEEDDDFFDDDDDEDDDDDLDDLDDEDDDFFDDDDEDLDEDLDEEEE